MKVCTGAEIGSDHYLVLSLLRIKLQSVAKINAKMNHIAAIERLRDLTKVAEYNIALKNRFEHLDTDDDLESIWGQFKQTVTVVSMKILGKRPRKVKKQHLSQKTNDLLIQRGQFKTQTQQ